MLAKAQGGLALYDEVRASQRRVLGDQSCLAELQGRLTSLSDHCLTNLGAGLEAMTNGDLTVDVQPVTEPLTAAPGRRIGELGDLFDEMLGKAQSGLESYNATRAGVAGMIGQAAERVASSTQQMASTTGQTSSAIAEAARTVAQTREAFDGLAGSIEEVSGCIDRISSATEGVASVASDAGASTQQVSASAQESSAATQEVAAAAQELASLADELDRLVGTFTR